MALDGIGIDLRVSLGTARASVGQALRLLPGALLVLDASADAALELRAGERVIARGAAVVNDGRLGLRIAECPRDLVA